MIVKHTSNLVFHLVRELSLADLLGFGHVLFDHQVDSVQRTLKVFFSQVGGEGLKVGGAMLVSTKSSEKLC